eukprot:2121635-Alexandrium_andersonii.AAC.1
MVRTWASIYRKIREKASRLRWHWVRGPIATTIITLLEAGWDPAHPNQWTDHCGDLWRISSDIADLAELMQRLLEGSQQILYARAAQFRCGKGLELGFDCPEVRSHLKRMRAKGEVRLASLVELAA